MLHEALSWFSEAMGIDTDPRSLTVWQMSLRAVFVYGAGIALVRLGDKRFLGRLTAFDAVMGVLIGSVLGRAVNGSSPLLETLAASLVLVLLHRLFAWWSFKSRRFGRWIKGDARLIIRDGETQPDALRRSHITAGDLEEMLRLHGRVEKPSEVRLAYYERNGEVSVLL